MKKKTINKKDSNFGLKAGLALGAIGAIATGYFLYNKSSEKTKKNLKGWMLKVKGEILEKIEKMADIDEVKYYELIDRAVLKYGKMKEIGMDNAMLLGAVLKKHWRGIKKDLSEPKTKSKKKSV